MEYITLYLHTDDECTGTDIYILLIQDDDNHCQTIRKDINAGNSYVWKGADLGTCEDATYFQYSEFQQSRFSSHCWGADRNRESVLTLVMINQ